MSPAARSRQGATTADSERALATELTRSGAVALPAHRGLRVPVELPHRRAGGARRVDRLALRPTLRFAQRVRHPARSPGRFLPAGSVRRQRPHGTDLRARHQRALHHMEHAEWLGAGARCADHGPATGQGRDHTAHATAGRRRLRPRARAHGSLPLRERRSRVGVRAGVRLRAHVGGVVAGRRVAITRPTRAAPVRRSDSRPTWRSASRASA